VIFDVPLKIIRKNDDNPTLIRLSSLLPTTTAYARD
jgi:hypothetical protein